MASTPVTVEELMVEIKADPSLKLAKLSEYTAMVQRYEVEAEQWMVKSADELRAIRNQIANQVLGDLQWSAQDRTDKDAIFHAQQGKRQIALLGTMIALAERGDLIEKTEPAIRQLRERVAGGVSR